MDLLSRSAILKVAGTTEIIVALYANQLAAHAYVHAAREPRVKDSQAVLSPDRHGLLESHKAVIEAGLARQNQVAESMIRWAEERGLNELASGNERKRWGHFVNSGRNSTIICGFKTNSLLSSSRIPPKRKFFSKINYVSTSKRSCSHACPPTENRRITT